jgi:penicillin-binding protein 1A
MKKDYQFWKIVSENLVKKAAFWCSALVAILLLAGVFIVPVVIYFSKDLPDYRQLVEYNPPTISRIYSSDGTILSELAAERRIFKKIEDIPELVKNAFIAAEDQNYYKHPGIDVFSIVRAALHNIANIGSDKNPAGGSTITQQVVKNFLLTNERTLTRKIKEAILAYRINNVYTKDRILELYLNQIYLGNGAYGVAQAAISYFNKDMKELTIQEAALLAAMPKAPSVLDPTRHINRAKARRDWVIERMEEEGFVSKEQAAVAISQPIELNQRYDSDIQESGYYNETVRLDLIDKYGHDHVYQDGLTVHTNLNQNLQKIADQALRQGLIEYDRRHGWHGVLANKDFKAEEWKEIIKAYEKPGGSGNWKLAIVLNVSKDSAAIGLQDGSKANLLLANMDWARKQLPEQTVGKKPESVKDVLKVGDIILVDYQAEKKAYTLEQIPDVNGALVAMEVKTGKVLAMTGGYSFKESKYNRVVQALRQPGSAFKPLVYLTALEKGFSPSSIVRDEPMSISQGPGMPMWTPKNYEGKYLGEITMRKALEKSRNLATVYLLTNISVRSVAETAVRLHVYKSPPLIYSMALGAYETTLMDLTSAFATFASGGIEMKPVLIDRVFDRNGKLVYSDDKMKCSDCLSLSNDETIVPKLGLEANYLVDPAVNYQMISMLEGVVQRGTGMKARSLGKHLAGKTGTTNDSKDTWFIGFSPDIVVGVFVGFDAPKCLGQKEQGASLALPIFVNFMKQALDKMPDKSFPIPEGVEVVAINPATGEPTSIDASGAIIDVVRPGQRRAATEESEVPEGAAIINDTSESHPETESLY